VSATTPLGAPGALGAGLALGAGVGGLAGGQGEEEDAPLLGAREDPRGAPVPHRRQAPTPPCGRVPGGRWLCSPGGLPSRDQAETITPVLGYAKRKHRNRRAQGVGRGLGSTMGGWRGSMGMSPGHSRRQNDSTGRPYSPCGGGRNGSRGWSGGCDTRIQDLCPLGNKGFAQTEGLGFLKSEVISDQHGQGGKTDLGTGRISEFLARTLLVRGGGRASGSPTGLRVHGRPPSLP